MILSLNFNLFINFMTIGKIKKKEHLSKIINNSNNKNKNLNLLIKFMTIGKIKKKRTFI